MYLGAVEKLNLVSKECVMVAAHLSDLRAARENGLRTVYVERPGEEDWDDEKIQQAKREGWVDLWIDNANGNKGFITVAEYLGIDVTDVKEAARLSSSAPTGT